MVLGLCGAVGLMMAQCISTGRRGVRAHVLALAVTLTAVGLVAVGCGGSNAPSVANLGSSAKTVTSPETPAQAQDKWAACIRAHGVPNFPDPNSSGQINLAGININSPQFFTAHRDCEALVPPPTPAESARAHAFELRVATCMRKHGVPNFPDPGPDGKYPGGWPQSLTSTPIGEKAAKICNPGTG